MRPTRLARRGTNELDRQDRSSRSHGRARRGAPEAAVAPPTGVTGSLQLRLLGCGSCNGCEVEITSAFSPVYDAARFGARLVASPRHADALLATGVVTHNMRQPLLNTLKAIPEPRVVIAVGDCAVNGGVFNKGY